MRRGRRRRRCKQDRGSGGGSGLWHRLSPVSANRQTQATTLKQLHSHNYTETHTQLHTHNYTHGTHHTHDRYTRHTEDTNLRLLFPLFSAAERSWLRLGRC